MKIGLITRKRKSSKSRNTRTSVKRKKLYKKINKNFRAKSGSKLPRMTVGQGKAVLTFLKKYDNIMKYSRTKVKSV